MKMESEKLARIRWNCRRGMLELDIVLTRFFDRQFPKLSNTEKAQFEQLLYCHDQDLFNWILGSATTEMSEFHEILLKIKHIINN